MESVLTLHTKEPIPVLKASGNQTSRKLNVEIKEKKQTGRNYHTNPPKNQIEQNKTKQNKTKNLEKKVC